MIRRLSQQVLGRFGLRVSRLQNDPHVTLLGLRSRPIRSVIDVGANVGQFGRWVRAAFPEAALVCFEPQPEACRELRNWARAQRAPVTVFELALGEASGFAAMWVHTDHSPSSSLLATTAVTAELYPQTRAQRELRVAQSTLDESMAPLLTTLQDELLVKLDVQGYEDRVIAGGEMVLRRAAACIVEVSLDALYAGQPSFEHLAAQLNALGLRYAGNLEQTFAPDGHVVFLDALFVRPAA